MPKGNPEGYLKKAKKEHKKAHGELLRAAEAAGLSMAGAAVGAAAKKVRKTAKDAGCPSDVGRITDAAAADIKAAEKAKKKAKKAKDAGRITNKARKFVGVTGRFPGGRLRD